MKAEDLDYVPPYLDNPKAAYMLSDPMWVLSENIVIDRIAKKVAEEPMSKAMTNPMTLAWRKKSKMSFYRLYKDGTTQQVYVPEDSGNESTIYSLWGRKKEEQEKDNKLRTRRKK